MSRTKARRNKLGNKNIVVRKALWTAAGMVSGDILSQLRNIIQSQKSVQITVLSRIVYKMEKTLSTDAEKIRAVVDQLAYAELVNKKWLDKSKAPKNGTLVLAMFDTHPTPTVASWNSYKNKWVFAELVANNGNRGDLKFTSTFADDDSLIKFMPLDRKST